jgi:hypothetical protein
VTILKTTLTTTLALGVCSLLTTASADVFNPRYTINELHSMQAGNTSGSYAAATMMGAQGFGNVSIPNNWDSMITTSCHNITIAAGGSLWPSNCNPSGMAAAVQSYSTNHWITVVYNETDQASALSLMLAALQSPSLLSPAVVPIYGQADHWVVVTQITAALSGGVWNIQQVKALDGGPPSGIDSSFNSYEAGTQAWGANSWKNIYFKVLTAINPGCDPNCNTDPYFSKYVIDYEPPVGQVTPQVSAAYVRAPGVLRPGETMNELQAQVHVWDSLTAAAVNQDPSIWGAIRNGVPGPALAVNAVFPTGARWDYYLVPIVSAAHPNTALAFVQVSADDGSFDGIQVPNSTVPFTPVSLATAQRTAAGVLTRGESLGSGILTWDARTLTQFAKSPSRPYYEFQIFGSDGKEAGMVRVPSSSNKAVRTP